MALASGLWLSLHAGGVLREVWAGDYHDRGTLACGECHVMHFSAAPGGSGTSTSGNPGGSGALSNGTVGSLLRRDINELCLSCHDGSQRAPDVLGANQGRAPGALRQAGFLNQESGVGLAPTGHTLGSTEFAPGSDPPWNAARDTSAGPGRGLNCVHCHAPHGGVDGKNIYRNLRSDAGNNRPGEGTVTYNAGRPGSNDLTLDVFLRRERGYDEADVDFNEPQAGDSAMARFCAGCHDRFHGAAGSPGNIGGSPAGGGLSGFLRHPAAGVDLGAVGSSAGDWSSPVLFLSHENRVKVMSSLGAWDSPAGGLTPTCITCHRAHGNDNAFGLIYRSGSGTKTENGDTGGRGVEDLCRQCHGTSPFVP